MTSTQPAGSVQKSRASFHGDGGSLFGIIIVNLLLTIVTLGIYSFWGKAKVRRYMYGQTEFSGDRFAYHGTGKELFIGAIKAFFVFALLAFATIIRFAGQGLGIAVFYLAIAFLIPVALHGAVRYAMSRTSWRGIRFSFRGSLGDCIKELWIGMLLTIVTIGIYRPYFEANMRRYWLGNTYFGNTRFGYDGTGGDLIGRYLLGILLTLPTLGLYWIWYAARKSRYDWSHTSFSTAHFSSTVTGGELLWLAVSNLLLLIVTLGLAFPWIMIRSLRFQLERTAMEGQIDWRVVMADAKAPTVGATGEGLADGLDVGIALS
jgi:uncharacterized membrane protein YjgN (DUF898 family)